MGVVAQPLIPALRRQGDQYKFKVILVYTRSSRPAKHIHQDAVLEISK